MGYTGLSETQAPLFQPRANMVSRPNGHRDGPASRRFRFDDLTATLVHPPARATDRASSNHSGRRLVLVAGATILILWASLYLIFRGWRSRYRARADFGATQVAPVIDALAGIAPPGVNVQSWCNAVLETHSMLVSVTGANLLDLPQMQSLRAELEQSVVRAQAHPETAQDELAGVWNAMSDRAEFLLQEGSSGRRRGHPRPAILPPRPVRPKGANPAMPISRTGSGARCRVIRREMRWNRKLRDPNLMKLRSLIYGLRTQKDRVSKATSVRILLQQRVRMHDPIAS